MVREMVNHFAFVNNDSLEEYGVLPGQTIYLAGSVLVPLAEDSFDYRMKFLGAFVIDDHITVNDDRKMFYIDPDNFTMMTEDEEAHYIKIRDEDFKKDEQTVATDEEFVTAG